MRAPHGDIFGCLVAARTDSRFHKYEQLVFSSCHCWYAKTGIIGVPRRFSSIRVEYHGLLDECCVRAGKESRAQEDEELEEEEKHFLLYFGIPGIEIILREISWKSRGKFCGNIGKFGTY